MKTKQNRRADGWSVLFLAAALTLGLFALGLLSGCAEEPVAPGGTVILEIQTIIVKSPAGEKPDDGKAEGRALPAAVDARDTRARTGSAAPGARTVSIDRVVASIIDVASGELLAEEELVIIGSTASGRVLVDVYGSVEAEIRIRMFEAGLLTYLGRTQLLLVPNGVFHPVVPLSTVSSSGVRGTVQDQQTSQPIVGATALLVETGRSATSGTSGLFSLETEPGTYTLRISATGYENAPDRQVTVTDTTMTDIGIVTLVPTTSPTTGVRGEVQNAQLEQPIVGATALLVESGLNTVSGQDGTFELQADPGTYTLRVSATGFLSTDQQVTVTAGAVTDVGVVALVTEQAADEIVIVLTWGTTPADLDAHLSGPQPGTVERFHVYWSIEGSRTSSPFAHHDRDDVDGEGPETISITQRFTGTYRFLVHDYSNRDSSPGSPSEALSNSRARVRVIINGQEMPSISVPTGQPGSLWRVLEIDGDTGAVEILNTFSYESSSGNIG